MMKTMSFTKMMSHGASAPCANAGSCCAQAAFMQSAHIALLLDAMVLASIIICGIICTLAVRVSVTVRLFVLAVLVLLVVLLVYEKLNMPRKRMFV